MNSARLTDAEIRARGWEALVDALGASGALRFAIQTERGYGDFSEFRHRLLGKRSVDELIKQMREKSRRRRGSRRPKTRAKR